MYSHRLPGTGIGSWSGTRTIGGTEQMGWTYQNATPVNLFHIPVPPRCHLVWIDYHTAEDILLFQSKSSKIYKILNYPEWESETEWLKRMKLDNTRLCFHRHLSVQLWGGLPLPRMHHWSHDHTTPLAGGIYLLARQTPRIPPPQIHISADPPNTYLGRTPPPKEENQGIRSMSGRYASYWNAFLFRNGTV